VRGAVFLDRDNTIVADPDGYLHEPDQVVLLPGAADGLAALAAAGWPLVVVSNQSGIARGMFGPEAFTAVMDRIGALLAPRGVIFAGAFFCPHHPDVTGPCDCRKPGLALYLRAARLLNLDLARSWAVGDRVEDAEPALHFGGGGILVAPGDAPAAGRAHRLGLAVEPDLAAAARRILAPER